MFDKTPKPYQEVSIERCVSDRKHFVLYWMGLGKTVVGVNALHRIQPERVLLICPKNSVRTWVDHLKEWFPGLNEQTGKTVRASIWRWHKRSNNAEQRRALWRSFHAGKVNIYIMTSAAFVNDVEFLPRRYDVIIVDEPKLRNRKAKTFEALKPFCMQEGIYFWPMSGTPGREPAHFFTLFHLCNHKYYRSYWKFVGAFNYVMKNEWGRQEILGLRNAKEWYRTLSAKASIVTKDMVKDQTGKGTIYRQKLDVEMDDTQRTLYQQLSEDMMAVTDDKILFAKTSLERTLRFRQLLVCPKILDPNLPSYGGAIEDLVDTLAESDPHVVVFTPFKEAIPYIAERIRKAGHNHIGFLHGGITPDEQATRIAEFRLHRGIIICTIAYAQSFSLEPADRAFFIGYEFNPEDNQQAEYRLCRFTTEYLVNTYYYNYRDTYDDQMVDIVCIKQLKTNQTLDPKHVGLKFDQ